MKKNLYLFLLSAVALVVFSSTTWAQKTQREALDLTSMEDTDKLETEGWQWEKASQTLTIDGLDISTEITVSEGALKLPSGNVTIVLEGDGTIVNYTMGGYGISGSGTPHPNLTIKGTGTLSVSAIGNYGCGMVLTSLAIEEEVTVISIGALFSLAFEYTVPEGYTYWTNSSTSEPTGDGTVSNGSVTLNTTPKYIKIVAPAATLPVDFTLYYNSADGTFYDAATDGNEVTTGFTGSYTGSGSTLTLEDFEFTTTAATAIQFSQDMTLNLVGNSSITSTFVEENDNSQTSSYGIYTQHSLTIESTSNGTLTATGGTTTQGPTAGVEALSLAITGGTLEGKGGPAGNTLDIMGTSLGIYVSSGDLTISGGDLIGESGTAIVSSGIQVRGGNMIMSNGSLTTTAAESIWISCGLDIINNMTVTGGTVTATSGDSNDGNYSYGILVSKNLSVTGGTIEAICGTNKNFQAGIVVNGTSTTTGMNVTGGATAEDDDKLVFDSGRYKSDGVIAKYVKMEQTIFTGTVDNKDSEKDAITWTFDSTTGVLTISGAGEMQDYSNGQTGHWFTHKADIQTVVVEKGITEIGAYSFFEFSNLTSVSFPEGLTSIISYAFLNTALTSITLPESLSNLGSEAFFGCSSLAEVTALNPKAFQISDRRIFEGIADVATLYVPASGLADYKLDFYGWTEFFSFILPISSTPSVYHTLNLEVADGIDLYNLTAGNHQVENGGHLYLQFLAEDRSLTANDILFLIDGIEVEFNELGENNYFSYILNPVTQDHTILIALKEYPVTLPEVDGITYNVGAGTHWIGYSEKFTFTLTLADGIDPANVHIFANGREIGPSNLPQGEALRASVLPISSPLGGGREGAVLTYTIDKVITPITVVIEGAGEGTTGNADIARGDIQLRITNYELQIENTNSQAVNVAVYAVTGQSVVQLRGLRGSKTIRLQPGIYLVKAGSQVYKVSVK